MKLCETVAAAAYDALPVWLAWIVHDPASRSDAVVAETVQILGVAEKKLTGSPELAVAAKVRLERAICDAKTPKLMVCGVPPVPIPLRRMFCVADALSALSVNIREPLSGPVLVGTKLIGRRHD